MIDPGSAGFGIVAASGINALSAAKSREFQQIENALNREHSDNLSRENREHAEKMQLAQMQFSMLQMAESQDFQRELANFNAKNAREIARFNAKSAMKLEEFRQSVNIALQKQNLDFQKWRFEQEKQLQYKMLLLGQAFQREYLQTQHQNSLEQIRERIRADNSPITILAADLLDSSLTHEVIPLKVLLSPPVLDYDPNIAQSYKTGLESFLAEEIRQFLHQGYLNSKERPVQLVDKSWSSKKYGGGSALYQLHPQLKAIPVLVLESEIVGPDEFNYRLGFWSGGNVSLTESSVLSRHPFQELLYQSARQRALAWQETREKLVKLGRSAEYIQQMGGVNEENLQVLKWEEAEKAELREQGIDPANFPFSKAYKISDQDYKNVYQYIGIWHCLTIGFFADILFLQRSWRTAPLLPSLLPYLLEQYHKNPVLTPDFWQKMIRDLVKGYGDIYDQFASSYSRVTPEIRMDFALSLADLPHEYRYLALEQANKALCDWLRANNVPGDKVFNIDRDEDCQLLKRLIYQEDEPFLRRLELLLEKVRDVEGIDRTQTERIDSLLVGWRFLKRWGTIPRIALEADESEDSPYKSFDFETVTVDTQGREIKREKKQAEYFTEDLGNGITLDMVAIPAGTFMMGSPSGEGNDYEKPQHKVTVSAFFMGKYPITQAQWRAVASLPKIEHDLTLNPSHFSGDNHPVERVSWEDAVEFCKRLSKLTGKDYTLPSEARWEYACRAGTTTPFHCGETITPDLANYQGTERYGNGPKGSYRQTTTPVSQFSPNAFGLYDMHGNVWEWCEDNWRGNYQGNPPTDGSAWKESGSNSNVLRGGSWYFYPAYCRSANRLNSTRSNRNSNLGFRVMWVSGRTL